MSYVANGYTNQIHIGKTLFFLMSANLTSIIPMAIHLYGENQDLNLIWSI